MNWLKKYRLPVRNHLELLPHICNPHQTDDAFRVNAAQQFCVSDIVFTSKIDGIDQYSIMASHGVPRSATQHQRSAESLNQEIKQIEEYKALVQDVTHKVREEEFSPELLQQTAALLSKNPEYYTMWNIRRRIYAAEFKHLQLSVANGEITKDNALEQTSQIIQLDLQFLFPLLLKFPKCYWIWHHRLWLLEQSSGLLPPERSRRIWENELDLVGKMLTRDSRNFHGWGYRRIVVQNLESSHLQGDSMARKEFEYTTKMIGSNLSNFSAWHNRTKLILQFLNEESASASDRKAMLESELGLIHKALFDPYDQSLWFYHQSLMCTFDPLWASRSMAPELSTEERAAYVAREREFIEEVLDDADDCKWAYQALLECAMIEARLKGSLPSETRSNMTLWLGKLKKLDPLRGGRWADLEAKLA